LTPIRHLFLDLEDTVITPVTEGWFNTHLINVPKLKAFIAEYQPDFVHIFSFAVWNQEEKKRFVMGTQPRVEKALGVTLSLVPTVDDDIIRLCEREMNLGMGCMDFSDMSDFWGKAGAFRLNMRQMWKSGSTPVDVVLLDDAVYNEIFEWPDLKVTGRILNIDQMKEPEDGQTLSDSGAV